MGNGESVDTCLLPLFCAASIILRTQSLWMDSSHTWARKLSLSILSWLRAFTPPGQISCRSLQCGAGSEFPQRTSRPQQSARYALTPANDNHLHRTGVLCIILCFALGIANIFHLHLVILFSIICLLVAQIFQLWVGLGSTANSLTECVPSY